MIPKEWNSVKFENAPIEIIDGDRGNNYPHQGDFSDSGYCLFLNAGNVTKSGFVFDQKQFITKEKDNLLRKGKLQRNDFVLTTRGTVGNAAHYDQSINFDNIRINSGMVILRIIDNSAIDGKYFFQYLKSHIFTNQITGYSTGSAQPQLPIRDIIRLEIPLPPLPEQRAIADVLSALDDKIELNRSMNQTLEQLAQTLYKYWFIDNPDSKNWTHRNLGDDFNLTMGQSPPGSSYNENRIGIPFFQGKTDFGFRYPVNRIYCTAPTRFAKAGDTLVSVRAPVGNTNMAFENCAIGRGVAAVRHKSNSRSFTYYSLQNLYPDFQNFESEGTVFGSINKESFLSLKTIHPPDELVSQYEKQCFPLDQLIENNSIEIRTLTELRDT